MRSLKDLFDLHDRVALVTGGAGHLGIACADALAENGARVVIADLDPMACDDAARRVSDRFRVECAGVGADLSDPERAATDLVEHTLRRFGRLDILVNNAAFTGTTDRRGWAVPFVEQTLDAWNAAIAVNLSAPFCLAKRAFDALAAHGCGTIINVSSIYSAVAPNWSLYDGLSMANPIGYGATKGGLNQVTKYLSTIMAPAVRVNGIAPGGIARNQPGEFQARYCAATPLRRMATEEDMKAAFAYLASDASSYVTGQTLFVDGGWTAW